jgi:predicted DNA binding CopG/RHH family protein
MTEPGTESGVVRDVQIYVRVSEPEYEQIATAAKRDGMAPATWMRMAALRLSRQDHTR